MGNPESSRTAGERWAIRVTFRNGEDAWLRHGSVPGVGQIVTFTNRRLAEKEAAFVREGLSDGDVAMIVSAFPKRRTRRPAADASDPPTAHTGKPPTREP